MDIPALKQQARTLEQQGNPGHALDVYQQILAELEAIGGVRQELPLLIKIGDLLLKLGDTDGSVTMYERAAEDYAIQGAVHPVISLCTKIIRADPQAVAAYLRLARRLLDNGHIDGARDVLMDYAERANLERTREGLERLVGRPDDEVKQVLGKAIESAEARAPKRPPPPPPPEPPKKRLTVPVGALDAELDPNVLEILPPVPRPERVPEPQLGKPDELQAPVLPETPAPPRRPSGPVTPLPKLPDNPPIFEPAIEPPRFEAPPPEPPPPPPALMQPSDSLGFDPTLAPPPAPPPPPPEPPPPRPSRILRRPSRASLSAPRPKRRTSGGLWALIALVVLAGGIAALIRFDIIPLGQLRVLLPGQSQPPEGVNPPPEALPPVIPDSIMARDTSLAALLDTGTTEPRPPRSVRSPAPAPAPARAPAQIPPQAPAQVPAQVPAQAPAPTPTQPTARPTGPPTLPPGVVLSRPLLVIGGARIESVSGLTVPRPGFEIAQVLASGARVVLQEFPSQPAAPGEIRISRLPPDTVVGQLHLGDLDITLKAVIPEAMAVQLLQQLVEVRPPN